MKKNGVLSWILACAILASTAAFAEETTQRSIWSDLGDKITASAESRFYGPALTDLGSPYTPNVRTGAPQYLQTTENKLALNYWIRKDLAVSLQYENYWNPVTSHDLSLKDPSIALKANHVIHQGIYNMDTVARLYGGFSQASQSYSEWAALRLSQSSSWRIPNSRVRFDFYTHLQKDFLTNGANDKSWSMEYLVIPSAEYRFSRTVAGNLSYKLWAYHTVGQSLLQANTDKGLAGPGLVWNIRSNLSFNPYIDIAVNNMVAMSTTTVGALLWWGFL